MLRRMLFFCACVIALPLTAYAAAKAEGAPMEKFSYTADFEEKDTEKVWVGSKDYIVNFKGLTDEKSVEGKKCFKLDITFGATSYIYWCISLPKPVPAEGSLKFTGNVFLDEGTAAKVEIGPSYSYPPSTVSGTCPAMYRAVTKEKWLSIQGDLIEIAKSVDIGRWTWGNPELPNVGRYLTDMNIRLYGQKGDRVIIYLDDFKIEGEVPVDAEYRKEATRRWAPIKEMVYKKVSEWEKVLNQEEKNIKDIATKTEDAEKLKNEVLKNISALKIQVKNIKARGAMTKDAYQQIDNGIKRLEESRRTLATLLSLSKMGNPNLVVTTVLPISTISVLPTGIYGELNNKIAVTAAQGEYEPASFIVHAIQNIKALTVKARALKQGKQIIPASNIDIKIVKCWYQAGTAWYGINQDKSKKVLIPELLLNDDSLVKVDTEKKENYLKLSLSDGDRYTWISDPNESLESAAKSQSVTNFPVKDSPVLLPVDIPADGNKQFWITVKVPEDAAPGIYTGNIQVASAGGDKTELALSLKVLPFKLPKPYYDSSIYYRGTLDPQNIGTISSEKKSRVQLAAELKNMVNHGITNPTLYQNFKDKELLKEYLAMRTATGIDNNPLYYLGVGTGSSISTIREFLGFASQNGIKEVYFYGKDEARGNELVAQREKWAEIRGIGGKVFVAGYRGESFKKTGDIQDLLVCAAYPYKEEAELWHSTGHKIWNYANPQGGVEDPEVYRRNFGLLLWQNGYDGACTYAYQHGMGSVWNDFDHNIYRDHNFTYPTVDGVIDTIAWEGYREGVDDIRYLTKLQQLLADAEKSKDKKRRDIAGRAKAYLKTINAEKDDLDAVRAKMIDYIIKLR
ncbi:MAG: hypothetical protein WCT06_02690 [Armatimonadota bacterium]